MKTGLSLLLFCFFTLVGNTQLSNIADQLSSVGTIGKFWAASCSNGEYALAGGGRNGFFGDAQPDFHLYHIPTDTWQQIPDYPLGAREGMIAFSIDNRLFVGMGSPFIQWTSDLHEFDLNSMSWVQQASAPGVMAFADAYVLNGKAYIMPMYIGQDAHVMAYEASSNTWEIVMPYNSTEMVQYPIGFSVNNAIYFGAGPNAFGSLSYARWYRFDPAVPEIVEMNELPQGTDQSTAFAIGNTGYMYNVGGNGHQMYRYDAASDNWESMGQFGDYRIANACSFADDTYGYIVYGETSGVGQNETLNELWRFTPVDESIVAVDEEAGNELGMYFTVNNQLILSNIAQGQHLLQVFTAEGKMVREFQIVTSEERLVFNPEIGQSGIYLFRLITSSGELKSVKGLIN